MGVAAYDLFLEVVSQRPWRHLGACATTCRRRLFKPKPIFIPESPPPSKTASSPFAATPEKRRRRMEPTTPRAGKRMGIPRRARTVTYNPAREGDCGYQCLLVASGMRPTKRGIQHLRAQTARVIGLAADRGEVLGGVDVNLAIAELKMTKEQYVNDVARGRWASAAELTAAAQVLNVTTTLYSKYGTVTINEEPQARTLSRVIVMHNQHYVLKQETSVKQRKTLPCKGLWESQGLSAQCSDYLPGGNEAQHTAKPASPRDAHDHLHQPDYPLRATQSECLHRADPSA